ncbi:MAG: DMT family transporter [Candidatus Thiothrix sulfatifontis]|nr:MAG: DMT family transporter [Candidatus Thiothrix sulfatifontis]
MMQKNTTQFGLTLAIGGTALFALKSIFIKLAYAYGVDTTTLLTLRMLIALPFYAGMLLWLLRKPAVVKPLPPELLMLTGLGFMGYYLASWLDMEGLQYISAQLERLTLYTYPIMTTLLGWLFLREKITWQIVSALVLTYGGILLLYAHEAKWNTNNAMLGVTLVTLAALTFAFYVVFSKRLIGKLGSLLFTSIIMLVSTGFIFVQFLLTHALADLGKLPLPVWGYAVLLAIFSTLLPSFMVSEAIHRIGAAKTSIVGTVGPVLTILLAVWLLGEPFGWFHLAGMALVMGGVSLLRK